MQSDDLGFTCVDCSSPMDVAVSGDNTFIATCPSCGGQVSLCLSEQAAYNLYELRESLIIRRLNEHVAITKGKVVKLNSSN